MRILAISDTHGYLEQSIEELDLTGIDVLIHAGDSTNYLDVNRNKKEFDNFVSWFYRQDVPCKIYVPGNHDSFIYNFGYLAKEELKAANVNVLESQEFIYKGVKFYGDPYTPTFGPWCYMKDLSEMEQHWSKIPEDTEILITHGPPFGVLDSVILHDKSAELAGCPYLRDRIRQLDKLKIHIFGHIHDGINIENYGMTERQNKRFYNVSSVRDRDFKAGIIHTGQIIEI